MPSAARAFVSPGIYDPLRFVLLPFAGVQGAKAPWSLGGTVRAIVRPGNTSERRRAKRQAGSSAKDHARLAGGGTDERTENRANAPWRYHYLVRQIREPAMKYLTIAVLLAIVAGAIVYHFDHDDQPPPPEQRSGWTQR